jgi:hypothetical protein
MKRIAKHLPHYFSLLGILSAGFVAFWFFSYDRLFQTAISIAVAASYIVWGIVHHYIHHDLTVSVVIEYLVIASLGMVIVFSLILRS